MFPLLFCLKMWKPWDSNNKIIWLPIQKFWNHVEIFQFFLVKSHNERRENGPEYYQSPLNVNNINII